MLIPSGSPDVTSLIFLPKLLRGNVYENTVIQEAHNTLTCKMKMTLAA
jgi:hypothetical protein